MPIASDKSGSKSFTEKFVPILQAAIYSMIWKSHGRTVVATNGCFDLLHVGHVTMLEKAKRLGDKLIVGINTDRAVRLLKGEGRPINKEHDRALLIAALASVDMVVLINEVRVDDFLSLVKPTIWTKGGDYTLQTLDKGEVKTARSVGARIELIPIIHKVSTTDVLKAVKRR